MLTPGGNIYTEGVFTSEFYSRYLDVFDTVYVIGRIQDVSRVPEGKKRADGEGIRFLALPPGRGVGDYLRNSRACRKLVDHYFSDYGDCAILRVPGVVANQSYPACAKSGKPYALEVVVDPWEYFSKGANGGFVRPFVRCLWTASLKHQCLNAKGVSYVTERYLQKRYPCHALEGIDGFYTASYSSVELPDDSFGLPKTQFRNEGLLVCHAANNFSGNAKGHYTLMRAARILLDRGVEVRIRFIGDGPSRRDYEAYVQKHGLSDTVEFVGRLPDGNAVRDAMRNADIFVFPTMAEGLPRVLLEAMAEGLPCLSSPVCGIPEVLDDPYLIDQRDASAYADRIEYLMGNHQELARMSRRNLEVSKGFARSILQERRTEFYRKLSDSVR